MGKHKRKKNKDSNKVATNNLNNTKLILELLKLIVELVKTIIE